MAPHHTAQIKRESSMPINACCYVLLCCPSAHAMHALDAFIHAISMRPASCDCSKKGSGAPGHSSPGRYETIGVSCAFGSGSARCNCLFRRVPPRALVTAVAASATVALRSDALRSSSMSADDIRSASAEEPGRALVVRSAMGDGSDGSEDMEEPAEAAYPPEEAYPIEEESIDAVRNSERAIEMAAAVPGFGSIASRAVLYR